MSLQFKATIKKDDTVVHHMVANYLPLGQPCSLAYLDTTPSPGPHLWTMEFMVEDKPDPEYRDVVQGKVQS